MMRWWMPLALRDSSTESPTSPTMAEMKNAAKATLINVASTANTNSSSISVGSTIQNSVLVSALKAPLERCASATSTPWSSLRSSACGTLSR